MSAEQEPGMCMTKVYLYLCSDGGGVYCSTIVTLCYMFMKTIYSEIFERKNGHRFLSNYQSQMLEILTPSL